MILDYSTIYIYIYIYIQSVINEGVFKLSSFFDYLFKILERSE
jgi:hypothetical protein